VSSGVNVLAENWFAGFGCGKNRRVRPISIKGCARFRR
jgi:hypothetical protein